MNDRITELEAQIKQLNARVEYLEEVLIHKLKEKLERYRTIDNLCQYIKEKYTGKFVSTSLLLAEVKAFNAEYRYLSVNKINKLLFAYKVIKKGTVIKTVDGKTSRHVLVR